jgi:mono/diheme cytochrome c family protein
MLRLYAGLVAALVAVSLGVVTLTVWPLPPDLPISEVAGDVKRGAYLARLSGCIACHTSPGGEPWAGGAALTSKFGNFYAPNITPHPEEGIGNWTFSQFVRAVRQGVAPDGDTYYPAFPYEFYAGFTDADMADLWAAMRALPPSAQETKPHQVGFPFNIRKGVKVWRTFFERPFIYQPAPSHGASWNRGRYIVEGPGHCVACHTPRNLFGGLDTARKLAGDPKMQDGGVSPPLTPEALSAKGWTRASLTTALKRGVLPDGDVFGGSMAEVVHEGTSFLLEQNLTDIATYLLDLEGE